MISWQGNVRFQLDCIICIFFAIAYVGRGQAEILVPCETERKSALNGMINCYIIFFYGYVPGLNRVSKNTSRGELGTFERRTFESSANLALRNRNLWPCVAGGRGLAARALLLSTRSVLTCIDCTTSVLQSADAAFLAECWDFGSRERAVIFRGTCNSICLFRKHVVSVIQVYSYCIKCKTFQFPLLPKICLPSEMQAEPDLSLV